MNSGGMSVCWVPHCSNESSESPNKKLKLHFFRFPSNRELKKKWLSVIPRADKLKPTKHSRICQMHFKDEDIRRVSDDAMLNKDAIPCFFPNRPENNGELENECEMARQFEIKMEPDESDEDSALSRFVSMISVERLAKQEVLVEDEALFQPIMPLNPTFKCEQCDFKTKNRRLYKKHTRNGTQCLPHDCNICKMAFRTIECLEQHKKELHNEDRGNKKCDRCQVVLSSAMALKLHTLKEHADYEMLQCPACPFSCFLVDSLERHVLGHSSEELVSKAPPAEVTPAPLAEIFKCKVCDFIAKDAKKLETHQKQMHPEDIKCKYGCGTVAKKITDMLQHYALDHRLERHSCTVDKCKYSGFSKETLLEHMFKHTGEKAFQCDTCGDKYESRMKLSMHIMRKHTKNGRHICEKCGRRFIDTSTFKRHMMAHTKTRPFACDRCEYRSTSKYNCQKHMEGHDKMEARGTQDNGDRRTLGPNRIYNRKVPKFLIRRRRSEPAPHFTEEFKCDLCEFRTTHLRLLRAHVTMKHDVTEKRFQCDRCSFRTSRKQYLVRHIKYMHGEVEMHSCPKCSFKSKYLESIVKHAEVHAEDPLVYKCHLCDYSAACSRAFRNHKMKHAGIKPHACPECPYRAVDIFRMRRHRIIHTGLKPYACKLCPFRCADKTTLIRHAYTHGKPKPHACDICSFRTAFPGILAKHRKVHLDQKSDAILLVVADQQNEDHQQPSDSAVFDLNTLLE